MFEFNRFSHLGVDTSMKTFTGNSEPANTTTYYPPKMKALQLERKCHPRKRRPQIVLFRATPSTSSTSSTKSTPVHLRETNRRTASPRHPPSHLLSASYAPPYRVLRHWSLILSRLND
jgi:hypothetical protein